MIPPTADEAAQWQFEQELIDRLISRVERVSRDLLTAISCPTNSSANLRDLQGEAPAPWPAGARARNRAERAMQVLVLLDQVRHSLALGHENARMAAYHALSAGLYAGDGALAAGLQDRASMAARERAPAFGGATRRGE